MPTRLSVPKCPVCGLPAEAVTVDDVHPDVLDSNQHPPHLTFAQLAALPQRGLHVEPCGHPISREAASQLV